MAVSPEAAGKLYIFMTLAEAPFLIGAVLAYYFTGRLDLTLLLVCGAVLVVTGVLAIGLGSRYAGPVSVINVLAVLGGIAAWKVFDDSWLIGTGIIVSVITTQLLMRTPSVESGDRHASR